MRTTHTWIINSLALAGALALASPTVAQVTITDFDNFTSDALYPSWDTATIVSGPTSYSITATGYGSNYKYVPTDGLGFTMLELTVSLDGPPAADGHLGPIIGLIDGDGTHNNYAWYGQTLGTHILTMDINSPTWNAAPGAVPGFDVSTVTHMHMQLDPGGFGSQGAYTVVWENLALIPEPSSFALLSLGGAALAFVRRRHG